MLELDVDVLSGLYGVVLSLAFAYIPGVREWFDAQSSIRKAQVMVGFMLAALVLLFVLSCNGIVLYGVVCSALGAVELLKLLFAIAVANQAAYLLVVRPQKVKG